MKRNPVLFLMIAAALSLTSCWSTRTCVGDYKHTTKVDKESTYTYSKGKQTYLFWGLIPLGRTNVATPADGNCEIRTRHGFLDALLSFITGGLFSMQTIKVKAPKTETPAAATVSPATDAASPQSSAATHDAELDAVKQMLK